MVSEGSHEVEMRRYDLTVMEDRPCGVESGLPRVVCVSGKYLSNSSTHLIHENNMKRAGPVWIPHDALLAIRQRGLES